MKKGKQVEYAVEGERYPRIKYVSCFDIFYDPTAESIQESRYVIERKIMHKDDIIRDYKPFIGDKSAKIDEVQKSPYYFNTHDYNRIKLMSFWNNETLNELMQSNPITGSRNTNLPSEFNIYYKNFLTIDYKG